MADSGHRPPKAGREEVGAFLQDVFPNNPMQLDELQHRYCRLRFPISDSNLRPGGTVSGPTMMTLADTALYAAVLGSIGIVPLAVTTSLNINFLRRPRAGADLVGECHLIKLGRSLAVGEVGIYSEGDEEPVAHAVGTYSIPPDAR